MEKLVREHPLLDPDAQLGQFIVHYHDKEGNFAYMETNDLRYVKQFVRQEKLSYFRVISVGKSSRFAGVTPSVNFENTLSEQFGFAES